MKISTKRIFKQLKNDLTGKDSHSGITLSYAWLANQIGHVFLGFLPAFLLYTFCKTDVFNSAIYTSLIWLSFELINFLAPLLYKKPDYIFNPKWKNLAFDTFTDVCFFALGAFLFSFLATKGGQSVVNILIICILVYLCFASRYWYITKIYQQNAKFPFQFRLSQWSFDTIDQNKNIVNAFLASKTNSGNHLLIYGDFGSGKTSLGVGILNELSIQHKICLYKNGIKMFNAFFDKTAIKNDEIWNWRTADFLMIDNINPSKPIQEELVTPEKLLTFIDTLGKANKQNREQLVSKNVIWIFGSKYSDIDKNVKNWEEMLVTIGVPTNKISTIDLSITC